MLDGYTEDDLKGLSAAERAILQGDDDNDDAALQELADGNDDDDAVGDKAGGKGGNDAGGDDGAAAAAGADGNAKPDATQQPGDKGDADADGEHTDTGVTFTPQTPADAEKTRETLIARKDEAFTKLMDGEIDSAAYKLVEKEVDSQLQALLQASITDNVTATLVQANTAKAWQSEVAALIKTAAAEGLDYKGDEKLMTEFNRLVKVFGAEASESGMSDDGLKASKWALRQAHETMQRRHGKAPVTDDKGPGKGKPREKADLSAIPPNLGKAPVAANANITEEFAHLDSLSGSALEKAVARLTPEQLERYSA